MRLICDSTNFFLQAYLLFFRAESRSLRITISDIFSAASNAQTLTAGQGLNAFQFNSLRAHDDKSDEDLSNAVKIDVIDIENLVRSPPSNIPSFHDISRIVLNDQDSNVKAMIKRELKEEMETKLTEKLQELETKIREKMENEVNELKLSFRKGVAGPATDQASGSSRLGRRTTTLQPGWINKSQVLPSDDV